RDSRRRTDVAVLARGRLQARWPAAVEESAQAPSYILLASRDGRRAGDDDQGVGRARQPRHDDALHAPEPERYGLHDRRARGDRNRAGQDRLDGWQPTGSPANPPDVERMRVEATRYSTRNGRGREAGTARLPRRPRTCGVVPLLRAPSSLAVEHRRRRSAE